MRKPVRKISLLQLAHLSWTDCSVAHKGVRKRTDQAGTTVRPVRVVSAELKNPMKLQWFTPLAMRMLIPRTMV